MICLNRIKLHNTEMLIYNSLFHSKQTSYELVKVEIKTLRYKTHCLGGWRKRIKKSIF